MTKNEEKLIAALKDAINCVQWCRRKHRENGDEQGIPSEVVWLGIISEVEGRPELSPEEFLLKCVSAVKGELLSPAATQ